MTVEEAITAVDGNLVVLEMVDRYVAKAMQAVMDGEAALAGALLDEARGEIQAALATQVKTQALSDLISAQAAYIMRRPLARLIPARP